MIKNSNFLTNKHAWLLKNDKSPSALSMPLGNTQMQKSEGYTLKAITVGRGR